VTSQEQSAGLIKPYPFLVPTKGGYILSTSAYYQHTTPEFVDFLLNRLGVLHGSVRSLAVEKKSVDAARPLDRPAIEFN